MSTELSFKSCGLVNMDISFLYFIFVIYTKFVWSEEGVCTQASGNLVCCAGYWIVDDRCVLCPKGSYGDECNEICPEGTYGAACEEQSECETDQICDVKHGCVGIKTELSESTTTHGDLKKGGLSLQYFYITPIVVIWILCIVALSLRCRKRLYRTTDVNNGDAPSESRKHKELQPFDEQSAEQIMQGHEYIEIIDVDSMYLEPCRPTNADLECRSHEVLPAFEEQNMNKMTVEHEYIDIADDSTYLEPCSRTTV